MSSATFTSLPIEIRRAIIAEAHAQARANDSLVVLGIDARLARAYRALVSCA